MLNKKEIHSWRYIIVEQMKNSQSMIHKWYINKGKIHSWWYTNVKQEENLQYAI